MTPGPNTGGNQARKSNQTKRTKSVAAPKLSKKDQSVSTKSSKLIDNSGQSLNGENNENSIDTQQTGDVSISSRITSTPTKSQRERISSLFDSNQDNKRPILRVNLIKKSSRRGSSLLTSLANRRHNHGSTCNVTDNSNGDVPSTHHTPKSLSEHVDRAKVEQTQSDKLDSNSKRGLEESQDLVVSLIKDIGRTGSKKDLDELLNRIQTIVGQIRVGNTECDRTDQSINKNVDDPNRQGASSIEQAESRDKFIEDRANKFREALKKVDVVKAWREEDSVNLKQFVQKKLQKAEARRKAQLDKIIRKAHDEDSKVSEIHFINNLEAQNRRHDINSRKKEFEARLQDLQDERQRKFEEKQAKEAAAEERRKTLEAERQAKLQEIQRRRKIKDQKVQQQQQVKEKKRLEKNRDLDLRITAIKEAYNHGVLTLKKKINQKQEQSERRHEMNLRLIRQKAFELSIKRYNSFIGAINSKPQKQSAADSYRNSSQKNKEQASHDTRRLQLKPFTTKKICNLCRETITSEAALFSHLRSEMHHASINEHYGDAMLTTNEAVEIHNLRHILETNEPLDSGRDALSDDQQSSRASSLVNYYHGSQSNGIGGGVYMTESDRESLLAIEKKCRKLRHKLIVAGKPFNRDWFMGNIRHRLALLLVKQRLARDKSINTDVTNLANMIDLSANNSLCQHNKPFYLKIARITRELVSVATDQRISGGGIMPSGVIHSVDRLLADLTKQLNGRKVPSISTKSLLIVHRCLEQEEASDKQNFDADELASATKMIETYAIDTIFLYDIISSLVSILRKIVPNVSMRSKLPSTVANHYSSMIDPISLNSYYCHRCPILPARVYIKMINILQNLCGKHSDLCHAIFLSNSVINLSDILSYRLGFIIGNESPASSISGSSSAATLSASAMDRKVAQKNQLNQGTPKPPSSSPSKRGSNPERLDILGSLPRRSYNSPSSNQGIDEGISDDTDDEEHDDELWDSKNEAETYKRTEDVVDDMTAALCKLLATINETILGSPLVLLNRPDKSMFYQRSDDFISYMVSVGIVDTESVILSHIHHQQRRSLPSEIIMHQSSAPDKPSETSSDTVGIQNEASNYAGQGNMNSGLMSDTGAAINATSSGVSSLDACSQPMSSAAAAAKTAASTAISVKITNFATSCIQFVTSLVKLVAVKLNVRDLEGTTSNASDGQDRNERLTDSSGSGSSNLELQDRTQLLATLRMSQLSGVLTLTYEMLVHSFNSLEPGTIGIVEDDSRQRDQQLCLALHSLRLANYVAFIDLPHFQAILSESEMLPLQFRHICSFLIGYLTRRGENFRPVELSACELELMRPTSINSEDRFRSELMNEVILALGNFAQLNETNQLWLKSGPPPTVIEQLVNLPFDYFSRRNLKSVLIPTLINCAFMNDKICDSLCEDISLHLLTSFIKDQVLNSQLELGQEMRGRELLGAKLAQNRWKFESLFPKSKWLRARQYLESHQNNRDNRK